MSLHRTMPDFSRKFRSSSSGLLEDLDDFLLEEFFSLSSSSITLEIKNGCQDSVPPLYSFSPSISRLEPPPLYPGNYSLKISTFLREDISPCLGRICPSFSPQEIEQPSSPRRPSRCTPPPPRLAGASSHRFSLRGRERTGS